MQVNLYTSKKEGTPLRVSDRRKTHGMPSLDITVAELLEGVKVRNGRLYTANSQLNCAP